MQEFGLVVEEQDGEWGFNIQFDRMYDITQERLPVDSDTAARIMDEAYMSGYSDEELGDELGDGATVGTVAVADDGSFDIQWDGDAIDAVYGE